MEMDTKKWEADRDISEMVRAVERGELAPSCETCPLWESQDDFNGFCHATAENGNDRTLFHDWYCEHHPLYPAWAMGECLRRVQKLGGAK